MLPPTMNRPMMDRPMMDQPMQNAPMQQPLLGQRPPMQNMPMQQPLHAAYQAAMNQQMGRADNAPMQNAPMQNAPMQNQPMQNAPMQNAPMQNQPMQNAPMQQPGQGGQQIGGRPSWWSAVALQQQQQQAPMQNAPTQNQQQFNQQLGAMPQPLAGGGYVQSANRFPVMLHSEGGAVGYAKGGLHDEAMAVRRAGRGGDSRLVHVNDDEFRQMKAEYGEPTINPETGMPEFFLGKFGKILKAIAPIAVSFIPGIGPVAAAALGAGLGALGGGGIKGALLGGISGGLGAGGLGGIGGKLGTSIGGKVLGQAASSAAKNAIGQAVIQGALGTAAGKDPLTSAIGGAATGFLGTKLGSGSADAPTPKVVSELLAETAAPFSAGPISLPTVNAGLAKPISLGATVAAPDLAVKSAAAKPNWWNREVGFLGKTGKDLGIQNKHAAIVGGLLAAGALDATKKKGQGRMTEDEFFGDRFSGGLPAPRARLGSSTASAAAGPLDSYYSKGYAPEYKYSAAKGGVVPKKRASSFAVTGPGTGRSDDIPAMLSDGEYVIDAETVALLGDGSTKAGAKRLDDFRIEIRKQKGSKLAKGKISRDAKAPVRYMVGGRI